MNSDPVRPGERVLCAVSGGADSVYLLVRMLELGAEQGFDVLCAHYHHGQRGAEADRDEQFVRDLCEQRGVRCIVGHYAGGRHDEAALREARYAFLRETAEREDCAWIATAHTADDQLETMLLNLARGTGLRGLAGISPAREGLLRPMLGLTRAEIEAELAARGVPHVEDSSNRSDAYARNRIRREAVGALRSVNEQAVRHAAETAALLREDEEYLQSLAQDVLDRQSAPGVALSELQALSRPVRARVFRLLFGGGLSQTHVEALHAFCFGTEAAALDLPGVRALREQGRLLPAPPDAAPVPETPLSPGADIALPEQGFRIRASLGEMPQVYDSLTVYHFKSAEIRGTLSIASRRPGDSVRLTGRGCTKSVSDLFAERGVPASQRDRIPVLRDGAGVAGVYGFGVAERLAAQPGDVVLTVTIERMGRE